MMVRPCKVLVLVAVAVSVSAAPLRSWSGGRAGIELNLDSKEVEIYSVTSNIGGVLTHWWITGGNKTHVDSAIVTYYVDDQPTVQFTPNMAAGVGFVDDTTPCDLGNCPEINSPWGNPWIGKGSGMGGWYNNLRVPFSKTLRATIKSNEYPLPENQDCIITQGFDFFGNDLPNEQHPNISDVGACCDLCSKTANCLAYTYHAKGEDAGFCFLKSSSAGSIPSSIDTYSGCIKCAVTSIQDPSIFTLIRGVYGDIPITVGGIQVPATARAYTQSRWAYLQPLDYYNLVEFPANTKGLVLMHTLAIVSGNANFMEGCFHFYSPANQSFPGEIMATGTEDYYDSGYYFINAYPLQLDNTGFTWNENVNNYGPFATGLKWSAYKMHMVEPLLWNDGGFLQWRNGDVADPDVGKCWHEGPGTPVGAPTETYVRSLAFVYQW